jgi:hypothetical protein
MLGEMRGKLLPLSLEWDGMGLADREAAKVDMDTAENLIHDDVADCVSDTSQITIPGTGMKRVRPTTSCDKPPYEQRKKRSRFCTICKGEGHKSTTCPQRGDLPKPPRKLPKCSRCGVGAPEECVRQPGETIEIAFHVRSTDPLYLCKIDYSKLL